MIRKFFGFFDWRFLFSLSLLLLVVLIGYDKYTTEEARVAAEQRADRVEALQVVERRESAKERATLLAGQRELKLNYDDLAANNAALIAWLQARGYRVPVSLISSRVDVDGDGKDDSDELDSQASQREQAAAQRARDRVNDSKGGGSGKGSNPGKGNSNGGGSSGGGNSGGGGNDDKPGKSEDSHKGGNDKDKGKSEKSDKGKSDKSKGKGKGKDK